MQPLRHLSIPANPRPGSQRDANVSRCISDAGPQALQAVGLQTHLPGWFDARQLTGPGDSTDGPMGPMGLGLGSAEIPQLNSD